MEIRDARAGDVPGITPIYNDAVEKTTAIWNEQIVDDANRDDRRLIEGPLRHPRILT